MKEPTPTARERRGFYFSLVLAQTAGAAIILVKGVPIYRQLFKDRCLLKQQATTWRRGISAVLLIQTACWLQVRLKLD